MSDREPTASNPSSPPTALQAIESAQSTPASSDLQKSFTQTVRLVVKDVNEGNLRLPEFQRAYVWKPLRVRQFLDSLFKSYPTGIVTLLSAESWEGRTRGLDGARAAAKKGAGDARRILDGQQRITTLVKLVNRDRNFDRYYFHPGTQEFQRESPRVKGMAPWIDVGELWNKGAETYLTPRYLGDDEEEAKTLEKRIRRLYRVLDRDIVLQEIRHKRLPNIVEMFERLNRAGVKVSREELALANLERLWDGSRERVNALLKSLPNDFAGLGVEFVIKTLAAVSTNRVTIDGLSRKLETPTGQDEVKDSWEKIERAIPSVLDFLRDRAGFDCLKWLQSTSALIPIVFAESRGGGPGTQGLDAQWVRWLYNALFVSRYGGSSDTILNREIDAMVKLSKAPEDFVMTLDASLKDDDMQVSACPEGDLPQSAVGTTELSLLYGLMRLNGGIDWGSGTPIQSHLVGVKFNFEVHHIFPRKVISTTSFSARESDLGNLCFITKGANLAILAKPPVDYFPNLLGQDPAALNTQFVPETRSLWMVDKFEDFLRARRQAIASGFSQLLASGRLA